MERLTKWEDGSITYNEKRELECGEYCDSCSQGAGNCKTVENMIKKLATYEDLEEQGLLVRLPCKVEEKLWCIVNSTIRELRVHHFDMPAFGTTDIVFRYADGFKLERFVGEIGKTVFLTHEEAEKKLEEMKKDGE